MLDLGFAFLSTMPLSDLARPYLRLITKETGEIAALAVLDGSDIIHVAGSTVERVLGPTLTIGRRFNALYASSGRVIAAFMEPKATEQLLKSAQLTALTPHSLRTLDEVRSELRQIQRQGYAIVDQEVEVGVRSIALPVLNLAGIPLAAVTVLTNVATVPKKQLIDQVLPVLQRIVPQIPLQAT
ncbi:MAG: IclR family transcriptional regulator domain-containing protein [Mycobacteriales bacterium]